MTLEDKKKFIEEINNSIPHKHSSHPHYTIHQPKRNYAGAIILNYHQPDPGRLLTVELLKRTDINNNKIPIELGQSLYPLPMTSLSSDSIPKNSEDRAITMWNNYNRTESKLKDKWMKVRIRYSGNKLAVIMAIKTLYSISYG